MLVKAKDYEIKIVVAIFEQVKGMGIWCRFYLGIPIICFVVQCLEMQKTRY